MKAPGVAAMSTALLASVAMNVTLRVPVIASPRPTTVQVHANCPRDDRFGLHVEGVHALREDKMNTARVPLG